MTHDSFFFIINLGEFGSKHAPILKECFPDIRMDTFPQFWDIYTDFEMGPFHYRVITHFYEWIQNSKKNDFYFVPFFLGYIEMITTILLFLNFKFPSHRFHQLVYFWSKNGQKWSKN